MIRVVAYIAFGLLLISPSFAESISDSQIRKILIQQSTTAYPGNCPCPYFTDRAGRSCGRRSAYSKPGGYSPLCYDEDVTQDMIKAYKLRHKLI